VAVSSIARDALRLNCSRKLSIWFSMLVGELAILPRVAVNNPLPGPTRAIFALGSPPATPARTTTVAEKKKEREDTGRDRCLDGQRNG